ncbi:MAG: amidase [Bryobacteraceae bacterium]|nr:amidase [Bryobacteraceae bacterium]
MEPNRLPLREQARLVRERKLSPVELVEAHLAEIRARNPGINAFVEVFEEEALAAARAAAEAEPRGVLHGVPITIKDSFDIAGKPTLCGSRLRRDHRAGRDSTAVRRLREAGAILLGKTNTPEFLYNWETDNAVTGRTNNPFDAARTSGGSSGGEAAAIAAFCSAGGIGSDGGGSIRFPAHCCGIAGLKPTPGRVSAAGHFPEIAHPGGLLGVGGPMARDAADLRVLFEVLAGYDFEDPFSAPVPLRAAEVSGMRVGVMEDGWPGVPVSGVVRDAVRSAADALARLGFAVEAFSPKGMTRAPAVWEFFFVDVPVPFTRRMIEGREHETHWTGTEMVRRCEGKPEPTGREIVEMLAVRDKLRVSMLEQMEGYAVLLLPPCAVQAFPHRQREFGTSGRTIEYLEAMAPLTPFNLFGMPGLVIPWTVSDGLPCGVQFAAAPYGEELLLEIGLHLAR